MSNFYDVSDFTSEQLAEFLNLGLAYLAQGRTASAAMTEAGEFVKAKAEAQAQLRAEAIKAYSQFEID